MIRALLLLAFAIVLRTLGAVLGTSLLRTLAIVLRTRRAMFRTLLCTFGIVLGTLAALALRTLLAAWSLPAMLIVSAPMGFTAICRDVMSISASGI